LRPLLVACALLISHAAAARVVSLEVLSQEPFADGASFGATGAYERVRAIAHGELDPAAAGNAVITDIARAPRNARGMVEYDTDVFILRPKDSDAGNHVMLFDVLNRGNKFALPWLNDAADNVNDPRTAADAGNGFTFRRGYTLVWAGWQPEIRHADHLMSIRVPVATESGQPIVRRIRFETAAGTRGPAVVRSVPLPYAPSTRTPPR